MKKPTYAQLQQQVKQLEANMPTTYALALSELTRLEKQDLRASGLLVSVTYLDGRKAITPFMAVNGLSATALHALKEEILRSWEYTTEIRPPKTS